MTNPKSNIETDSYKENTHTKISAINILNTKPTLIPIPNPKSLSIILVSRWGRSIDSCVGV